MLSECATQHQQSIIYLCFVDCTKAFDWVPHRKLFDLLDTINIDDRDYRVLRNLYANQKAVIRLAARQTAIAKSFSSIRESDSAALEHQTYLACTANYSFESYAKITEGFTINGVRINNIRYADGTVIIAETEEGLQTLINAIMTVACLSTVIKLNVW